MRSSNKGACFKRCAVGFALLASVFSSPVRAFNSHQPFDITSDVMDYVDATQEMTAQGHVVIVQSSSTLTADLVRYDRLHKHLIARGNVVLRENGGVMLGDQMDYDLDLQKGIVLGGKGTSSSWFFQGTSWEKNEDYYIGRNASFTSCDLIDPHYHIRSSRVHLIPDRLFWAWNNVFYSDDHAVFYTPFMYKYLDKQYVTFQVQPGNDSLNGAFAKTTTTLRFNDHFYDKWYLDYYTDAGSGFGNELNFDKPGKYKGSLFGYYIDPHSDVLLPGQPPGPQYNLRTYLWQQLNSNTQVQANANLRSNISFNTQYFAQDPNQSQNDIISSLALTQQTKGFNQHLVVQREDAPDASETGPFATPHMQTASIPAYNFTMYERPLWSPGSSTTTPKAFTQSLSSGTTTSVQPFVLAKPQKIGPILFSMTGNAQSQYLRADELIHNGAQTIMNVSESFPFARRWTFGTRVSPQLNWQDRGANTNVSTDTQKGVTGRLTFGNNLRWRPVSLLSLDAVHTLTERLKPNAFEFARDTTDHGVETNAISLSANMRPSARTLVRSSSGYDFRRLDDESLADYNQRKWSPWNNDITYTPNKRWEYYVSNQLAHYPFRTNLWQTTAQYAGFQKTILKTDFVYNRGAPGMVTWNETVGYFFSPGWRVDASFNALVPSTSISATQNSKLVNTQLVVLRDLHCWQAQFIYRDTPPFSREYSVLVTVKLGAKPEKQIANNDLESQFYPWRATGADPRIR
jgi:lipopolysaccharide export system protein LptA